jgi:hypothetical protein
MASEPYPTDNHDKDQHEQLHDGIYLRSNTFCQGLAGMRRDASGASIFDSD